MSIVSFGEKILYTPQVDYTKGSLYLLPPSYFTMNYLSSTWKNKLFLVVSPLPVGKISPKCKKWGSAVAVGIRRRCMKDHVGQIIVLRILGVFPPTYLSSQRRLP